MQLNNTATMPLGLPNLELLIVEDNQELAHLFVGLMEVMGYAPKSALNGRQGLQMALQFHPHVIFCDLVLPGEMDGYEVARAIRATPELGHVMLIAVTGMSGDDVLEKATAAGFNHVLTKPVKFKDLQRLLKSYRTHGQK